MKPCDNVCSRDVYSSQAFGCSQPTPILRELPHNRVIKIQIKQSLIHLLHSCMHTLIFFKLPLGNGMYIRFSSRRRRASSISHGKLVAARTMTIFVGSSSCPVAPVTPAVKQHYKIPQDHVHGVHMNKGRYLRIFFTAKSLLCGH